MSSESLPLTAPPAAAHPVIGRGLTLLLAVLGGVAVGNLYWAQPLLHITDFLQWCDRATAPRP